MFETKATKIDTLFLTLACKKAIFSRAAHTYIAHNYMGELPSLKTG